MHAPGGVVRIAQARQCLRLGQRVAAGQRQVQRLLVLARAAGAVAAREAQVAAQVVDARQPARRAMLLGLRLGGVQRLPGSVDLRQQAVHGGHLVLARGRIGRRSSAASRAA